jgi:hypothetical protein
MPRPALPAIPEKKGALEYVPSGKYQLIRLPVLFIADLLIGILMGWLAPTIFVLAGLSLPDFEGASGGSIFNILMGILFGLAFLGALGYGLGWPMWQAVKFAKCRNPNLAGVIGGITSVASVVV